MKTVSEPSKQEEQDGEHGGQGRVSITIDGKQHNIRRGMHPVAELKEIGGVPAGYALDQIVGGKIEPLPDDGKVHIRGGEVFISHPRDSASS